MRLIYWILVAMCIICLYFSVNIHDWLISKTPFYNFKDPNLLQAILGVLAGLFTTKASDSSDQLKKIMKIPELKQMLEKAETAEEKLKRLESIIKQETNKQFARDMLISHRKQLINHWEHITALERVISENLDPDFDPAIRREIRNYILRTKYIDYTGRRMLKNVPVFGGILDLAFGPLWDTYYSRNVEKLDKTLK